ncbi:uncharacterized protein BX664DRAFT_340808 [Halteromyces radiatus]|uniref:uncharacterized protein n=1 Tax=Halteromyces radiatus TaxID=101107 RepID=UPI00221E8D6E|nr:uncharacterized protein BX664DRAFT_340808 [Halteromyces radiatus]KAI8081605.1 hypothetical protein BX664DRAFT_340808 [Halteromyces radiatus]
MTSPQRKNSIFNMMSFSPTLNMLASSPSSFATPSPFALRHRDSYVHQRELESQFCRDLVCCNQPIADLHELLQHYEEQHVEIHPDTASPKRTEEEEDDDDEEMEEDEDDTHGNLPILLSSQDMSALEHEGMTNGSTLGLENMDFSHFGAGLMHPDADKPYRCDVPGCDKAYKNPNGLKYHRMHGHCESTDSDNEADALQKPYQCTVMGCRKRYKNMNGLKYHIEHSHIKKMQAALPPWMATPWQLQQHPQQQSQHLHPHIQHPHHPHHPQQQQQQSVAHQSTLNPQAFL